MRERETMVPYRIFHVDVTYIVCMYGIVGKKLKNHLAFIFAVVKFS